MSSLSQSLPKPFPQSLKSARTVNPIRAIVDQVTSGPEAPRTDGKKRIPLSLGDPSIYGNLDPPSLLVEGVRAAAALGKSNGYVNAVGTDAARSAVASYYSTALSPLSMSDVVLGSGCSGAMELAITTLLDPGTTMLVPNPGFPLYEVIATSHGAGVKKYDLDPSKGWECDLAHMESLIDGTVRCILINNPSNPCGSVFSESHLEAIVRLAQKHDLPILSDEVYAGMVFSGASFLPLADVASRLGRQVPVITASGLAKQFLVPGWRVGWLTFHDDVGHRLADVRRGVNALAQVIIGSSHIVQAGVVAVLDPKSDEGKEEVRAFRERTNKTLEGLSSFTCDELAKCHGLTVVRSSAALYVMVGLEIEQFDGSFHDDVTFTKLLLAEENVFALPGQCFGAKNFFRVVYCAPKEILGESFERIKDFCERHKKK